VKSESSVEKSNIALSDMFAGSLEFNGSSSQTEKGK
tara:strand:- start:229 stop:336 length:108 start_codon:yes stop_codon:yes gene_type:complete